jgi:hypothetical protein
MNHPCPKQICPSDSEKKGHNAAYELVEECQIPANRGILADRIIRLTGARAQTDCPCLLRDSYHQYYAYQLPLKDH